MIYMHFNCAGNSYFVSRNLDYKLTGDVISDESSNDYSWTMVVPHSIAEAEAGFVCSDASSWAGNSLFLHKGDIDLVRWTDEIYRLDSGAHSSSRSH